MMSANPVLLRPRTLHLPQRPVQLLPVDGVVDSGALLKGQREIVIQHGDKFYRLRHTSNDKLIPYQVIATPRIPGSIRRQPARSRAKHA